MFKVVHVECFHRYDLLLSSNKAVHHKMIITEVNRDQKRPVNAPGGAKAVKRRKGGESCCNVEKREMSAKVLNIS